MKLLKLTSAYSAYVKRFYKNRPELKKRSYLEQKQTFDFDGFGWADFWSNALIPLGYEAEDLTINVEPMQRAWALENGIRGAHNIDLNRIAIEQVKKYRPDILWYDDSNVDLLKEIRAEVDSIKLVLGWSGSAIFKMGAWRFTDLILSCAPETVAALRKAGYRCRHLNHGFDPRINSRIHTSNILYDLSFIGLIYRDSQYHLKRERLLEELVSKIKIAIFSPSVEEPFSAELKTFIRQQGYDLVQFLRRIGISEKILSRIPKVRRILLWTERPLSYVNPKLRPYVNPGVYGLEMYQAIKESKVTLNIHADSSPDYASNMRLFEVTGAGTCLLTDWKKNINEFFEPEKEIVTYKSFEECLEKIEWLIEHPKEREAIAKAGQMRCLKDHTYSKRAMELDYIIKEELKML